MEPTKSSAQTRAHTRLSMRNIGLLLSLPGVLTGTLQPALAGFLGGPEAPPARQPEGPQVKAAEAPLSFVLTERSTTHRWAPVVAKETRPVPAPEKIDSPKMQVELREVEEAIARSSLCTCKEELVQRWTQAPSVPWNSLARTLVAEHKMNPLEASRIYALLSIAQYDATIAVAKAKIEHPRESPQALTWNVIQAAAPEQGSSYPSEHSAVGQASLEILKSFFPKDAEQITETYTEGRGARLMLGVSFPSDLDAGAGIGGDVASQVLRYAASHPIPGSINTPAPKGTGIWKSSVNESSRGLYPGWSNTKPFLMTRSDQFRPPPPPAVDSPEFKAALAEVRNISDHRSEAELRVAKFWADSPGTATPPGHWNQIAAELITKNHLPPEKAAQVFLHLNLALHDAGISCWETKYHYYLIRPSQVDQNISTPVGLPDFPSYTSGHATFSGAAAEVLGYFFPKEAAALRAQAEEAALSRVYGGIHYRFDGERGLEAGQKIGALSIERAKAEDPASGANLPLP